MEWNLEGEKFEYFGKLNTSLEGAEPLAPPQNKRSIAPMSGIKIKSILGDGTNIKFDWGTNIKCG